MVVKQASLAVVVAACAALFAAPVFAADAPAAAPAAPAAPAASSDMGAMHMAPAKKAHVAHAKKAHAAHAKKAAKKTVAAKHHGKKVASKHKFSCYDYAWQSADMQNCLAKHKKS